MMRSIINNCMKRSFHTSSSLQVFRPADRLSALGATVFSEFTELANQHKAINLGQGFPDWETPDFVKEAAQDSIKDGFNQYSRSAGHIPLVNKLAEVYSPLIQRKIDPMKNIVTFNGASEAGYTVMQSLLNKDDEVLLIEPFYDAYPAWVHMAGGKPVYVPLRPSRNTLSANDWTIDINELEKAVTARTKCILINTPQNPIGKVYTIEELQEIADFATRHDLIIISDEVYEFIIFHGAQSRIASLPNMWQRCVTISSAGKTFSATGWKIGWTIAPENISASLAAAHQWIPFCVSTPLQTAVARAMEVAVKNSYFQELGKIYQKKRDSLVSGLNAAGLTPIIPAGGYFVLGSTKHLQNIPIRPNENRDYEVCRYLTKEYGVASIPVSAFYSAPHRHLAVDYARFAFCKRDEQIAEGCRRLKKLTANANTSSSSS